MGHIPGELKESLTADIGYLKPPRLPPVRHQLFDENGYLKPPRLPRPANLRWWERLAYAWRGL